MSRSCLASFLTAVLLVALPACARRPPEPTDRPAPPPKRPAPSRAAAPDPPPQEEPATPSMPPSPDESGAVEALLRKRDRVVELLGLLAGRELSDVQREERDAGVSFLSQIQEALDAGDPERAAVLADKAYVLIQNLEQSTRP